MSISWDRAVLEHAAAEWREINRSSFRGALRPPALELTDSEHTLGSYKTQGRRLLLSRPLIRANDWLTVVEVLRHEMAHQYVVEVLRVTDEAPHGPAFQRTCAERGIDPRAAGLPNTRDTAAPSSTVRRIRALLALADSPNVNEARLAARKAYTLMHTHNVQAAELGGSRYEARRIGPVKARYMAWEKALIGLLGAHFFVQPLICPVIDTQTGKRSRAVEVSGTSDNLDMAEHVFDWLVKTGERLFAQYRRDQGLKGNSERQRFLLGLIQGFSEQLSDQRRVVQQTGLVWVGDPELIAFRDRRHGRIRSGRGGSFRPTDAYYSGREQGKRLELSRPVSGSTQSRGRTITQRD